jgi:hypothetical protein
MTVASAEMAAKRSTNPWMAALYGGVFTAVIAAAYFMLLGTNTPILWGLALILIGAGPVLGYQAAAGKLGKEWGAIVGGILGGILPIVGELIFWPLFVWIFARQHSLGRLYLGSILGIILGVIVFLLFGFLMGQNPEAWFGPAWAFGAAMWGATAAAFMTGSE